MQLAHPDDALPAGLERRFDAIAERLEGVDAELPPALAPSAGRVAVVSEFALSVLERRPDALIDRLGDASALDGDAVAARVDVRGMPEPQAMAALRAFRQVEMARIAWRDLTGASDLPATIADLSMLADGLIRSAVRYAAEALEPRFGAARFDDGRAAELLVLAMGKLGGRELNYSSDIDVIFLFPDDVTIDGPADIEPEEYFRRAAQLAIRLLDQVTGDGFVFRVDTRLRPFGASGPVVVSVGALESYLSRHGRDWERYAYVKARLVTGLDQRPLLFDEILTPFVFRRYLDYGVFDALRQMKALIAEEVARKDLANDIKRGAGGIREIEFIVQAFQLVRGGREPAFRTPHLLTVLPAMAEQWLDGGAVAARLEAAYVHLRTLENRLQAMDDRQTHELPDEPALRERLCYAMHEPAWDDLLATLDGHRRAVQDEFGRVAWETRDATAPRGADGDGLKGAWASGNLEAALHGKRLGADAEAVAALVQLRNGGLYARMDEPSRQRLADTLSRILPLIEALPEPGTVLRRLLPLLHAIGRRSAYLALLNENPQAMRRLLDLVAESRLLARQLAEHPLLLDELLDARLFDDPPSREELRASLAQHVGNAEPGNVEARLEAMQQFQRAAVFRIAIADRIGSLTLMQVSDRLTDTAELVVEFALETAWAELAAKHGKPTYGEPPELADAGFCIVGYGKLGGLELGYASDLDLVFLHDSSGPNQTTDGARPLDNARFFARLVQRIIHFLSVQTSSGRLYEVDTRLRPDGSSGLIVASLDNFRRYQRNDAWTWEHQALLRSRAVAGSDAVRRAFEADRVDVLVNHVDRTDLKGAVSKMRERMRTELAKSKAGQFDVKQDPGGLADIEFLIDYWVLENSARFPELVEFPDNVRQLEALARTGLLSEPQAESLKADYLALRRRLHELALNDADRVVDAGEFADLRARIVEQWTATFG